MENTAQIENGRALRLREAQKNDAIEKESAPPQDGTKTHVSKSEIGFIAGLTLINAGLDYLVIGSVPFFGDIIDGITWFVIFAWVASRGLEKPQWFYWAGAIEIIPFGDLLPVYTSMALFIYFYNNNPQFKAFFRG